MLMFRNGIFKELNTNLYTNWTEKACSTSVEVFREDQGKYFLTVQIQ